MVGKPRYSTRGYARRVLDSVLAIQDYSPRVWSTEVMHESSCPTQNDWGGDECQCFPDITVTDTTTGKVVWNDPGYEEDE